MVHPFSRENRELWLCLFAPPLVVKRKRGVSLDFYLSIELTILGSSRWIPGAMMAVYILYAEVPQDPARLKRSRVIEQAEPRAEESSDEMSEQPPKED
ncbi:hypothetical protein JCM10212_001714 [Sporobolomyces blumeae]